MHTHRSPTDLTNVPGGDGDDSGYYRGVLHELIDMGAGLARMVHQQAAAQVAAQVEADGPGEAAKAVADATVAFDRVARTVRRSVALARSLAEPPAVHDASWQRYAARKRIIRVVEDMIQREAGPEQAERLRAELAERLDGPDLDDETLDRPVAEIITDICRDLGITALPGTHAFQRRTPADVAALCARAAEAPRVEVVSMLPRRRVGRDPPGRGC